MLLRILMFLVLTPVLAQAGSRDDARERREVVKIFDLLTSKMDVTSGESAGSDLDCVFSRQWGVSWDEHSQGDKTHRPHELLSIQQALDPRGEHSEMFCDRVERDKQAQISAQSSGKTISAASFNFSYPIFGRNLQTATVHYSRASVLIVPDRKPYPPVSSLGVISLRKQKGAWTFKVSVTGMS